MVNIEINGIPIQARDGAMVIEAADEAGIVIPRFCYHRKLSIAANCRMCLVEVEKAPKPLPACATPVTDGMVVYTRSEKALEAQKGVMEFLLINHPLDCPICDQGGECELQDMAMGFGKDASRYTEPKRVVPDKDLGPLIATDMTRCIHCTRCVRFGREIAGIMELGATGRGEHVEIGTYVERTVSSEMSGNVIDLCPVGALTSKPYRYTGRPWENQQAFAVAPHDCVGSNTIIETRRGRVMRVLPQENEAINETWISDRDRFAYTAVHGETRLEHPMIKQGDEWKEVDWPTALEYAVEGIRRVSDSAGAAQIGAWVSPSSTLEELYLAQKLMRSLGSHNIDHRLRQLDFRDQDIAPAAPVLGCTLAELETRDAVLLIGSFTRKDQPLAANRLRKAAAGGASIMSVSTLDYDFTFDLAERIVASPTGVVRELAGIARALLDISGTAAPEGLAVLLENLDVRDTHLAIAKHLHAAEQGSVLIGVHAMGQGELAELRALANLIARVSGTALGYLPDGANSTGAWLAGAVPHRLPGGAASAGRDVGNMINDGLRACFLLGVEPEFDTAQPARARAAIEAADFVVAMNSFVSGSMKDYADVLLPITTWAETAGTYVNIEGTWQSFTAAIEPLFESRPAWKVLRVLGNLFELDGFEQITAEDVREEARAAIGEVSLDSSSAWRPLDALPRDGEGLQRIGFLPIYAVDGLTRRAAPLQATADAPPAAIYLNSKLAEKTGLSEGESAVARQDNCAVTLPVIIDEAVPDGCVLIPQAIKGTELLASATGQISVEPA